MGVLIRLVGTVMILNEAVLTPTMTGPSARLLPIMTASRGRLMVVVGIPTQFWMREFLKVY